MHVSRAHAANEVVEFRIVRRRKNVFDVGLREAPRSELEELRGGETLEILGSFGDEGGRYGSQ